MIDYLTAPPPQTTVSVAAESDRRPDTPATRHLCAGVYLDPAFRNLVIRKVHNAPRRRAAPSYGFDLVPVVRHAWRSWWLDVAHLAAIAGCLAVGVILAGPRTALLIVCAAIACAILRPAVGLIPEVVRLQVEAMSERWGARRDACERNAHSRRDPNPLPRRTGLLKAELGACAVFATAAVLLGASLGQAASDVLAVGVALVACSAAAGALRQLLLGRLHTGPLRPATLTRREQALDEQQAHPFVVYNRPEHKINADPLDLPGPDDEPTPFVGSGKLVSRWRPPMTVQLLRRDCEGSMDRREYTTPPFDAHQLVDRLRSSLRQLGEDTGAERLPGLRLRDRVYVAEMDVPSNTGLLGDEPALWRVMDDHQSTAHHFLETSAPVEGGELVITVLLRVSVKGRALVLDAATSALTRNPPEYRATAATPSAVLRSALRSALRLPLDVLRLPRLAELPVLLSCAWTACRRREIGTAAKVAVREEKADDWRNAQLDRAVIYDHMKIIEQRILKATADFLKEHDVDTSAFEEQATNIINNSGLLNMGGTTEVNQAAVGANAEFTQTTAGAAGQQGAGA